MFLTHPGPSLLVTALVVAAAALLDRQLPPARTAVGLVLVVLPNQLSVGALNDWADVAADAEAKPFKPIPRGAVPRTGALVLALCGFSVSLGAAAYLGADILLVDVLALAAGAGYDLWLKRTPAAVLAWWAGFVTVPLIAMVITGRVRGAAPLVPLVGLLALALLLANELPDREDDERAGAHTLASVLGGSLAHRVIVTTMLAAAVYSAVLDLLLGLGAAALPASALLAVGALAALATHDAPRLAFPLLALLVGAATVSWVAALAG